MNSSVDLKRYLLNKYVFVFLGLKNIRTTDGMLPVTFQSFRNCCKLDPGVYWVPLAMGGQLRRLD